MVRCGHCKQQHQSVREVRECFLRAESEFESSPKMEISTPEICWRCHEEHGNSLGEIWTCRDQVSSNAARAKGTVAEILTAGSIRGISCGESYHRHSTVPEARECYLQRTDKNRMCATSQEDQARVGTAHRDLMKALAPPENESTKRVSNRNGTKDEDRASKQIVRRARDESHLKESGRATNCKHGVNRERCFDCRKPPKGVNAVVYITKGGLAFHNRRSCMVLRMGQKGAESSGMNTHEVTSVAWNQVALERDACLYCCHPQ
jgi:hypothetical protein